jgi:hypothetical protein
MLNISKYQKAIVGCSAIATVACTGLLQSASAAELNRQTVSRAPSATLIADTTIQSQAGGGSVTGITGRSVGGGSTGGPSPAISGRATTISSRISVAQTNYNQAAANLAQAEAAQPVAANTTPVRFSVEKGVADLASCGCPNADVVGTAPTPSPELVAAKAAEADAAAELAAAKAEARQFIETVKNDTTLTSSTASSQLW